MGYQIVVIDVTGLPALMVVLRLSFLGNLLFIYGAGTLTPDEDDEHTIQKTI